MISIQKQQSLGGKLHILSLPLTRGQPRLSPNYQLEIVDFVQIKKHKIALRNNFFRKLGKKTQFSQ